LSRVDETTGDIKGTLENRVSGAAIHALIGAVVFFPKPRLLLAQVPLPVLSGVFLYLGFTSLQGLELWDRLRGIFKDTTSVAAAAAPTRWSAVPIRTTSLFTMVQILCVAAMMRVTKSRFGVVSPLMVAVLPLVRMGLLRSGLVKRKDMDVLDG
jgi:sodium bicarbonate transporter 10